MASPELSTGRATVATICRRVHCRFAINGDFFGPNDSQGGIVSDGRVVRSTMPGHAQLLLNPNSVVDGAALDWRATLHSRGQSHKLPINFDRLPGTPGLYTSDYGTAPPEGNGWTNHWFWVDRPFGRLRSQRAPRNQRISSHSVVIRSLLSDYFDWAPGAILQLPDPGVRQSIGGNPILMVAGQRHYDPLSPFSTEAHPRTVVSGAVDGSLRWSVFDQPLSLEAVTTYVMKLGDRWAINLDGGGSSTLVRDGQTLNHSGDKYDRRVASALIALAGGAKSP